jgi:hypothetical protein
LSDEENLLFRGDTQLNETLINLNIPKQIFDYFFDENIFNNIIAETKLFSAQKDITHPASVKKFSNFWAFVFWLQSILCPACVATGLLWLGVRHFFSTKIEIKIPTVFNVRILQKLQFYLEEKHLNTTTFSLPSHFSEF